MKNPMVHIHKLIQLKKIHLNPIGQKKTTAPLDQQGLAKLFQDRQQ